MPLEKDKNMWQDDATPEQIKEAEEKLKMWLEKTNNLYEHDGE